MRLHRPLPASADIVGHNRITHLTDKGAGKGAIMVTERRLETAEGELLATVQQVSFLRGDGGYSELAGGQPSDAPLPALRPTPEDQAPHFTDTQAIRPEAALLYRLMGDFNPLHADPAVAKAAGFDAPSCMAWPATAWWRMRWCASVRSTIRPACARSTSASPRRCSRVKPW